MAVPGMAWHKDGRRDTSVPSPIPPGTQVLSVPSSWSISLGKAQGSVAHAIVHQRVVAAQGAGAF
jgi:hypothetical protein